MFFIKRYTAILLLLFTIKCRAQFSFGLEAGVSNCYLNTSISNRASTVIFSDFGFTMSIPVQYKKDLFSAGVAPNITQKNYSIRRIDTLAGVYQSFTNTYLQLPLVVGVVYGKRLKIFAEIGVYPGYWLSGKIKGKTPDIFSSNTNINANGQVTETFQLKGFNEKYPFNKKRDNRWEFGSIIAARFQYQLNNKYATFIKAAYYQSLTDQQKNYMINQVPQYNQTITFSLGMMVNVRNRVICFE